MARGHEVLAQVLAYRNQDQEALAEFQRAIALGLVSAQLHANVSVLLHRLGRGAEADREQKKSSELLLRWSNM